MSIRYRLLFFSKCDPLIHFGAVTPASRLSMGNLTTLVLPKQKRFFSQLLPSRRNDFFLSNKLLKSQSVSLSKHSVSNASVRVSEQVVLYTFDNLRYLRMVNLFGCSFAAFWAFTSYQFATMRITPPSQRLQGHLPWYARFDLVSSTTRQIVAVFITAFVGCAVLGGAWTYSIRSVGKVILDKGGKSATFITYNPFTFSMSRTIHANVNEISCKGHRSVNDVVPIKVKGQWMHFLLTNDGVYHHGPLFDRTVGLRRSL